jgi:predicted esterase
MSIPTVMKAMELEGVVEDGQLILPRSLPVELFGAVRVIIMYEESNPELDKLSDQEFSAQLRARLAESGYETAEQIAHLVKEVKVEQADSWFAPTN